MNSSTPKYSIIIPTCNGIDYLPTCIQTIINQDYDDYELIISDDHSEDGTKEYIESINNPKIKTFYIPKRVSMVEHWEWALSHAKGEWCIFVGQDDGLQPYFFKLADELTAIASANGLRTINSSRSYYFWKGSEKYYNNTIASYLAYDSKKFRTYDLEVLKIALGVKSYIDIPQMYTTSLFNSDLIRKAKLKQGGKLFSCHPQDANLASIACSLEKRFLHSSIPLGWVGTSTKSAGLAITSELNESDEDSDSNLKKLKADYIDKIIKSDIPYYDRAGEFSFGNSRLYFWQTLIMTSVLRVQSKDIYNSMYFKYFLFSSVLFDLVFNSTSENEFSSKKGEFRSILNKNRLVIMHLYPGFILVGVIKILYKLINSFNKYCKYFRSVNIKYSKEDLKSNELDLLSISENILNEIEKKGLV